MMTKHELCLHVLKTFSKEEQTPIVDIKPSDVLDAEIFLEFFSNFTGMQLHEFEKNYPDSEGLKLWRKIKKNYNAKRLGTLFK